MKKIHNQIHQVVKDYEEYKNSLARLDDSINKLMLSYVLLLDKKMKEEK